MTRKAWVAVVGAMALVVIATGTFALGQDQPGASTSNEPDNTAPVERGPLSSLVSRPGYLTYRAAPDGGPHSVVNRAMGTYTALPAVGSEVACGDVLYRIDERPVLLLCGTVPAYRNIGLGDTGNDVRALNWNLAELGHAAAADPAGDQFTVETQSGIRQLQQARGLDVTGVLNIDSAIFLPTSARIAEVVGVVGAPAQPGAVVLLATSQTVEVQVELDASQQDAVHEGDTAHITLPGNRTTTARVDRLGTILRVATGPSPGPPEVVFGAYLVLDSPDDARGLDKAVVQLEIVTAGVDDALSVPVTALLGRPGGGYAVELVQPGGARELVAVQLGLIDTSGGRVQVEGAVRAGDRVVVPPS